MYSIAEKGMSTSLCTGFIKCVVSRYMQNESSVYGRFLNASKAFDLMEDIHLGKGASHKLVTRYLNFFFSTERPKYQEGKPQRSERLNVLLIF